MRQEITITAQHIERGEREESRYCPVALALIEYTLGRGDYRTPSVAAEGPAITLTDTGGRLVGIWYMTTELSLRIAAFDETGEMEPFVLVLDDATETGDVQAENTEAGQ